MSDSSHDKDEEVLDQELETQDQDQDEEGDKGPKSVLDAAMAALGEGKGGEASPADEDEGGKDAGDEGADSSEGDKAGDGGPTEDEAAEDAKLPFHKHPRFKQVIDQRNGLRTEVKQVRETYEPKAKAWDDMQSFVEQSGLSPEEIDKGFEIMKLLKDDPAKAHEMLQPMIQKTGAYTGERLPQDLQDKVDSGKIDAESASELAKARAKADYLEERRTEDAKVAEGRTKAQTEQQMIAAIETMKTDVGAWEYNWKENDPDFDKKQPRVMDRVAALVSQEGMPMTSADAIKLSERAKADVEAYLADILPKKRAKKVVTGGASGGAAKPRPKSALEAARIAAGDA